MTMSGRRARWWLGWSFVAVAASLLGWLQPVAAADLAGLRQRGVLRVGSPGDYAPFSVVKDGKFSGFDADLVTRLARDLKVRVEYVRFRWPDLASDLEADRFDIVAGGVTVRPERALAGRFTRPYTITGAVAVIRQADRGRFPDRLTLNRDGVRIVVNHGGHLEQVARRLFPRAAIEPVTDNAKLPERVLLGTADAALSDSAEARAWRRPELTSAGPFTRDRKAILVRRDAPELQQWIDTWLRARERDGWLGRLRQQWLGETGFFAAAADREAVLTDVELRCRLMPLVAATKLAHQIPIEDLVREQQVVDRARAAARDAQLDPERVAALFTVLIHAAKAIEESSGTDPHAFAPPLDQLRDAITDLDAHLVRQLGATLGTVKRHEWAPALREGVEADGLTEALKATLAQSLTEAARRIGSTEERTEPPAAKSPMPTPPPPDVPDRDE